MIYNNLLKTEFEFIKDNFIDIDLLKSSRILITGANGLIGSYLVYFLDYLNREYDASIEIYAMSRSKQRLESTFEGLKINIIEQDLNLPIETDLDVDYVIHAASNAHPLAYSQDPVGTMKTNILGTMNLLDNLKSKLTKFIYISSGEIYGNNIDHSFTEDDCGIIDTKQARSCYPESKRATETLCTAYNAQFGTGINIARLCYVYGPTITNSNSRADAQFLRNALDGKDIVMKSKGEQRRTYCYVADAVSAILTILLKGKSPEVYNVANPNSIVSIAEYAQTLADIGNVALRFELPSEVEAKGYSKAANSILDSSKLMELGWFAKYSIKDGLEHTFNIKKEMEYEVVN